MADWGFPFFQMLWGQEKPFCREDWERGRGYVKWWREVFWFFLKRKCCGKRLHSNENGTERMDITGWQKSNKDPLQVATNFAWFDCLVCVVFTYYKVLPFINTVHAFTAPRNAIMNSIFTIWLCFKACLGEFKVLQSSHVLVWDNFY